MNSSFKLNNASSGSSFDVGVPSLQVPSSLPPRGSPLKIQQSLALNAAYGSSGEIKIYVEPTVSLKVELRILTYKAVVYASTNTFSNSHRFFYVLAMGQSSNRSIGNSSKSRWKNTSCE